MRIQHDSRIFNFCFVLSGCSSGSTSYTIKSRRVLSFCLVLPAVLSYCVQQCSFVPGGGQPETRPASVMQQGVVQNVVIHDGKFMENQKKTWPEDNWRAGSGPELDRFQSDPQSRDSLGSVGNFLLKQSHMWSSPRFNPRMPPTQHLHAAASFVSITMIHSSTL